MTARSRIVLPRIGRGGLLIVAIGLALAPPAAAYVGPGAGFAFVGSFLSLAMAFIVGVASLLIWPLRVLVRTLRGAQGYKKAKVKKVIFLGLDGLEPTLTEAYMAEGKMPHLAKLKDPSCGRPTRRYRRSPGPRLPRAQIPASTTCLIS